MRGVFVRHEEGQSDTLSSSLPRGLSAAMPQVQRQLSYVQARAQIRLNARDAIKYINIILKIYVHTHIFLKLCSETYDILKPRSELKKRKKERITLTARDDVCLRDLKRFLVRLNVEDLRRRSVSKIYDVSLRVFKRSKKNFTISSLFFFRHFSILFGNPVRRRKKRKICAILCNVK